VPLTPDHIVHQNTGGTSTSSTSTAITVALSGGDTTASADSTVVVALMGDASFNMATPSGWLRATTQNAGFPMVFYRGKTQGMAGGESSWNFTPSATGGGPVAWVVLDIDGVVASALQAASVGANTSATSGTTLQTASLTTAAYDAMVIAFHGAVDAADATPSLWGSHTNEFVEVAESAQAGTGKSVSLSVSALGNITAPGTINTTATLDRTMTAGDYGAAGLTLMFAHGSKVQMSAQYVDGAEHGTVVGNTLTGVANSKILETATAGVTVDAAAARSGGFGWLLSSTAAACNFTQSNYSTGSGLAWPVVNRRHFNFPTLPASGQSPELLTLTTSGGTAIVLRYIGASGLLGLKVGTGTEVLSDTTITADQWFGVDIDCDLSNAAAYVVRWAVDYNAELTDFVPAVAQADALGSGTGTSLSNTGYRVGWTTSSTATCHTDDALGTAARINYPIGDMRVLPLKVDPAGTPTISGTSTNFGVMTNNGTIAAWNATNARNAVDDVPPDLSGTRDAAVCILASASDYAEFPAETIDLAANKYTPLGWRVDACLWAASATASTIRLGATDGTSVYTLTLTTEPDPNADNAATPVWVGRRLVTSGLLVPLPTQTRIDGLAFRIGSNDGNPDIGIDCFVFSVAVVKAIPETLFGEAGEDLYVEAHRDPSTFMLVGATVNNNTGGDVELTWEVDGTPDTSGTIPDGTAGLYVPISPEGGLSTVGRVDLIVP
jgi:hypothetical protein